MIETRIISSRHEIEEVLPKCIDLARRCECNMPSTYLLLPLIWWEHFNNTDGTTFAEKRGANFFGSQSRFTKFCLVIAEDDQGICGAMPVASFEVKLRGKPEEFRLLCFPGDSHLVPYQDFPVGPEKRSLAVTLMVRELTKLLEDDYDLLFFGYIHENSPNIPVMRQLLAQFSEEGLSCLETITAQRGGLRPWTIEPLIFYLNKIRVGNHAKMVRCEDMDRLVEDIKNCTSIDLIFPPTRRRIESEITNLLNRLRGTQGCERDVETVSRLLSPMTVAHPYIFLPSDKNSYFMTLGKDTRQDFRRRRRIFEQSGGHFEKITSERIAQRDTDDCLRLHNTRWGKRSTTLGTDSACGFHRNVLKAFAHLNLVTLFFACYEGRRIACLSCFDIQSRREAYFTGRELANDKLAAGRLLFMETICDAIENGFAIYDLGQGHSHYKMVFTNSYAQTHNFFLARDGKLPDLENLFIGYEYMGMKILSNQG